MSRGLLDTGVLIARSRIGPESLPRQAAITAITLGELAVGVHAVAGSNPAAVLERANRTLILQQVENEFDPIAYGPEAARMFGALSAAVFAAGRKPRGRSLDLMIAATAAVEGLPLYTTNPRDFAGIEPLVEIIPVVQAS
ncbi:MAG: type II toxin-antitoxin system VapC family toxin [Leucobacter sp.]